MPEVLREYEVREWVGGVPAGYTECKRCEGSGSQECRKCDGDGWICCNRCDEDGEVQGRGGVWRTCPKCDGTQQLECPRGDGDCTTACTSRKCDGGYFLCCRCEGDAVVYCNGCSNCN